jgi:hypothetical protein
MVWIFWICRFVRALQASQADRPQDASMTFADQNDSKCENEIVTLRGGVCLVHRGITQTEAAERKPAFRHRNVASSGALIALSWL